MNPQQPFELGPGNFDPPPAPLPAPAPLQPPGTNVPISYSGSVAPPRVPGRLMAIATVSIFVAMLSVGVFLMILLQSYHTITTKPPPPSEPAAPLPAGGQTVWV